MSEVSLPSDISSEHAPSLPTSVDDVQVGASPGADSEHADTVSLPGDVGEDEMIVDSGEEVALPPDITEDEIVNCLLDDFADGDAATGEFEHNEFKLLFESSSSAGAEQPPQPGDILQGPQQVGELFSPPRITPVARAVGLSGMLAMDLVTGWDLSTAHGRDASMAAITCLKLVFLMCSPPCTLFSVLQRLWNYKRMNPAVLKTRMDEAEGFMEHTVRCCLYQVSQERYFALEHPASSGAFKLPCVQALKNTPGVQEIVFDQCMLGLRSKVRGVPMRKRTKILTNSPQLVRAFSGLMCSGDHEHQRIEGEEGGVKRSCWAQRYPEQMVHRLVMAAKEMCQQQDEHLL